MKKSNHTPFQGIIGQQNVVEGLTQAIEKNQVSHSYIFAGPKGTQRAKMAYSFGKALFSQGEVASTIPDKKVEDHNHPDMIDVFPDGASIKIHQIRKIIQDISIQPYEAEYKIYIIHEAQTMGAPAQNALLKTLEEPPRYGIIILLTNTLPALLPTIVSRSQVQNFHRLREDTIQEHLIKEQGLPSDKARGIAVLANGSIERAVELFQKDSILQEREEFLQSLLKIIKGDVVLAFTTAAWLKERKVEIEEWLDFIMIWFRDVSLYQELGQNQWIIHREYEELLKEFSYYLSDEQIHDIIEEVNVSKNNMKYHVNLQLNMEVMLLRIQEEYHV